MNVSNLGNRLILYDLPFAPAGDSYTALLMREYSSHSLPSPQLSLADKITNVFFLSLFVMGSIFADLAQWIWPVRSFDSVRNELYNLISIVVFPFFAVGMLFGCVPKSDLTRGNFTYIVDKCHFYELQNPIFNTALFEKKIEEYLSNVRRTGKFSCLSMIKLVFAAIHNNNELIFELILKKTKGCRNCGLLWKMLLNHLLSMEDLNKALRFFDRGLRLNCYDPSLWFYLVFHIKGKPFLEKLFSTSTPINQTNLEFLIFYPLFEKLRETEKIKKIAVLIRGGFYFQNELTRITETYSQVIEVSTCLNRLSNCKASAFVALSENEEETELEGFDEQQIQEVQSSIFDRCKLFRNFFIPSREEADFELENLNEMPEETKIIYNELQNPLIQYFYNALTPLLSANVKNRHEWVWDGMWVVPSCRTLRSNWDNAMSYFENYRNHIFPPLFRIQEQVKDFKSIGIQLLNYSEEEFSEKCQELRKDIDKIVFSVIQPLDIVHIIRSYFFPED